MQSARETAVYMKYYKLLLAFGSVKCTHSLSERWTFIETCPTKIGKQKNISSLSRMQLASNRVEWIKSDTIGATNEIVYLLKNISKRSCRAGEEGGRFRYIHEYWCGIVNIQRGDTRNWKHAESAPPAPRRLRRPAPNHAPNSWLCAWCRIWELSAGNFNFQAGLGRELTLCDSNWR